MYETSYPVPSIELLQETRAKSVFTITRWDLKSYVQNAVKVTTNNKGETTVSNLILSDPILTVTNISVSGNSKPVFTSINEAACDVQRWERGYTNSIEQCSCNMKMRVSRV